MFILEPSAQEGMLVKLIICREQKRSFSLRGDVSEATKYEEQRNQVQFIHLCLAAADLLS